MLKLQCSSYFFSCHVMFLQDFFLVNVCLVSFFIILSCLATQAWDQEKEEDLYHLVICKRWLMALGHWPASCKHKVIDVLVDWMYQKCQATNYGRIAFHEGSGVSFLGSTDPELVHGSCLFLPSPGPKYACLLIFNKLDRKFFESNICSFACSCNDYFHFGNLVIIISLLIIPVLSGNFRCVSGMTNISASKDKPGLFVTGPMIKYIWQVIYVWHMQETEQFM